MVCQNLTFMATLSINAEGLLAKLSILYKLTRLSLATKDSLNMDSLRQTACMVVNSVMVDSLASLSN